jgi:hypothetical protein
MFYLLEVNLEDFRREMCDKVLGNLGVVFAVAFGDAGGVSISIWNKNISGKGNTGP